MILTAVPMLPKPETSKLKVQKSVLWPSENVLRGEWRVGKPSDIGSVSGAVQAIGSEETKIEKDASECRQPKAEGIETREGHIPRTDHQWDEVVRKSKQHGHDHEENHGGAMHGEHSIEYFGRYEIVMWTDELDAHDGRFDAADHEKHQGIKYVQDAQPLMVDGGYPLMKPGDKGKGSRVGPEG